MQAHMRGHALTQVNNMPGHALAQVSKAHYHNVHSEKIAHGVHQHIQSGWINSIFNKVINGISTSASIVTMTASGVVGTYLLYEGVRKISSPRINKVIEDRILGALYCAAGLGSMTICRLAADRYMPQSFKSISL